MIYNNYKQLAKSLIPSIFRYVGQRGKARLILPSGAIRTFNVSSHLSPVVIDKKSLESKYVKELSVESSSTTNKLVPWFLSTLPDSYFEQVPEALQKSHIKAIAAIHDLGANSDATFRVDTKSGNVSEITLITTKTQRGSFLKQLNSLPHIKDSLLNRVKLFSSADGELTISIFTFTPRNLVISATQDDAKHITTFLQELKQGKHANDTGLPKYGPLFEGQALSSYISSCNPEYLRNASPRRFMIQRELYEQVKGGDKSVVHFEKYAVGANPNIAWLTIAAGNALPESLLQTTATVLSAKGLYIWRVHMTQMHDPSNTIPAAGDPELPGYVTQVRLLISKDPTSTSASQPELFTEAYTNQLAAEINRAKNLDDNVLNLGYKNSIGIEKAEVIYALCSMLHGPLNKTLPGVFPSIQSVANEVTSNQFLAEQASDVAQLFLDKFRPGLNAAARSANDAQVETRASELRSRFVKIQKEGARIALMKMVDAIGLILRTNYFFPERNALAFRIDPLVVFSQKEIEDKKPVPYGAFFMHGRHFNGFHNRFRDIARGGLRVVTPIDAATRSAESCKHYDEVWGLSYAQQLKNKDIPEGGAKGVVQIDSYLFNKEHHNYLKRKAVRGYVDSLLDLMVPTEEFKANVVDYLKKEEFIYLGPDEQIVNYDIDWITRRAAERGYALPSAFMSSKKDAGFNHKTYGVTSEGVFEFLDAALQSRLKINPRKQPFTIKITGGPDGDVAGNLIKILYRECGDNAKIVGISDGFGVAEDPQGLNKDELLRLVQASLSVAHYDSSKLSSEGVVMKVFKEDGVTTVPEALVRRNTMAFRVKADVFVPGGGRPNAINADNWKEFFDPETGKPSSTLIVEGANLYNSAEARDLLFKNGVSIVKDSSANKCGVATSSCEIIASMLLSREEFLENKDELIKDVLVQLRRIARDEAQLLLTTFDNFPGSLPHFSERISAAINNVTDRIVAALEKVNPGDPLYEELFPIVKENIPKKLADLAWDRAKTRLPVQYQKCAIASSLASRLVYKEGIHLVESQPAEKLADRAFEYYRAERKMNELIRKLENGTATKEEIAQSIYYLRKGGARTVLGVY